MATVAQSLRSVDGLLAQGDWRMLKDGGVEIENTDDPGVCRILCERGMTLCRRGVCV